MKSSASPAASSRPQFRSPFWFLATLAACVGLTLFSSSCSTPTPAGPGYVSTPSGISVSSIRADRDTSATEWNPESLPFSGDARDLFKDLGPDYFANLLKNLPEAE